MPQKQNAPGRWAEGDPCPVVGNADAYSRNSSRHQPRKSRAVPVSEAPTGKLQRYMKSLRDECQARRLYARELEREVSRLSNLVEALGGDPKEGMPHPALMRKAVQHG